MILTVTANPAYDVTYRVERLEVGVTQRVSSVEQRAGGKSVNVCRVLNSLGTRSVATGFADAAFAAEAGRDLPVDFVLALPWVRRTLVVSAADGTTTGLWEPGAMLADPTAVRQLETRVGELLPQARGVVISGSLPRGVDPGLPAELARLAVAAGVPVICDVDGEALRHAVRVPGVVVMPNADELQALTGVEAHTPAEVVAVVRPLLESGVRAVIATRGADGMVAVTAVGAWSARIPEPVSGNPTGAGDAAAAAVISGLATQATDAAGQVRASDGTRVAAPAFGAPPEPDWPGLLADAVATSAAAVAVPVAGEIDHQLRARLARIVRVEVVGTPELREKSWP
ncbi:hexose kinase [Nocardia sp. NPDC051030]|uniref:hexose kinase n=1 Tax=Nocardia sp. NPDC051030 TaxID=3155162 RepID=UPI00342903F5